MYKITVIRDRPDFRVFIDLLYSQEHNVDTDGDAIPVNSRNWTYLYIKDRMSDDPSVEIVAQHNDLSTFEVKSKSKKLAELTAIYLFDSCGSAIEYDGKPLDKTVIDELHREYDKELTKAQNSIWHRSTDKTPYPNLE